MTAHVVRRVPLLYAAGADTGLDRPAYVRAASGLAWIGDKLAVVQDDASFIALVDVVSGMAASVTLPADAGGTRLFDDERGNKADKHDFESVLSTELPDGTPVLLAFGSGSTPRREQIAVVRFRDGTAVRLIHTPPLYAALRSCQAFAGSELNIEAAVRTGDTVRLFGRGNGDMSDDVVRVNATCDLQWEALLRHLDNPSTIAPPLPVNVVQFALGEIGGTRVTFTDAAELPTATNYSAGTLLYTGTAEASEDVVKDGPVAGSVIGIISSKPGGLTARFTEIRDAGGGVLRAKVEGVAVGDFARGQVFVSVDADDHRRPSEVWEVRLTDSSHEVFEKVSRQRTAVQGTEFRRQDGEAGGNFDHQERPHHS